MTRTFELSKPLLSHAATLQEWSVSAIRPHARLADERHRPPDNWKEILDSCPVPISRRDGHANKPATSFSDGRWVKELLITESLTYGDIWVSDVQGQGIGHLTVKLMGTPEQIERWYRPIIDKGGNAAFALTEPHFGSDTSMVATTATKDGDMWVLNGTKIYCSGGSHGEYVVVFANADTSLGPAGIRAFVVPKGTPGMIIAKANEEKLGIRSWQTAELLFQDCAVPLDHELGYLGPRSGVDGLPKAEQPSTRSARSGALGALAQNKPNISAMGLGTTQASIDVASEALTSRKLGFTPQRWSAIQTELQRMNEALVRIRRVNYGAQWLLDHNQLNKTEASVSKAYGPPTFEKIIRRCMNLLGPDGFSTDLLLEKWYRDMKILDIFEGSAQVQRIIIGRTLMGADAGRG
jgi:acyl-CoA dehydrogenase